MPTGVALAAALAPAASAAPTGLQVWLTCQPDIKSVCPGTGLLHLGALKACMKQNFGALSDRCQTVVRGYQSSRQTAAQGPPSLDPPASE